MKGKPNCKECMGRGEIELLTSFVPCGCVVDAPGMSVQEEVDAAVGALIEDEARRQVFSLLPFNPADNAAADIPFMRRVTARTALDDLVDQYDRAEIARRNIEQANTTVRQFTSDPVRLSEFIPTPAQISDLAFIGFEETCGLAGIVFKKEQGDE